MVIDLGHRPGGGPAAGTIISNQAAASYRRPGASTAYRNPTRSRPWCCPKAAFSLASDNTKQAAPGSTVYFSHALTNTGNAADQIQDHGRQTRQHGRLAGLDLRHYLHRRGWQRPARLEHLDRHLRQALQHGLGAGWRRLPFRHRRHGQRPGRHGRQATITVNAKSVNDPAATGAPEKNTDTLQVNGAAFNVNKSANLSSGPTGTVITYTFTIANTGNAAGDLTLTDALGNGPTAGLLYVSGSGAWSNGQGAR